MVVIIISIVPTPRGVMVMADTSDSTSVTVSWEAVTDADSYTVTFTRATGADQEGLCPDAEHKASVSVNTSNAALMVGQDVKRPIKNMLRAYSTYFITVVAMSRGDSSQGSRQISFLTQQTGMKNYINHLMASTIDCRYCRST